MSLSRHADKFDVTNDTVVVYPERRAFHSHSRTTGDPKLRPGLPSWVPGHSHSSPTDAKVSPPPLGRSNTADHLEHWDRRRVWAFTSHGWGDRVAMHNPGRRGERGADMSLTCPVRRDGFRAEEQP